MCAQNYENAIFAVSLPLLCYNGDAGGDMRGIKSHIRDFLIMAAVLALSFALTVFIQNFFATETTAPVIFVLAVFIIALTTDGYKWGVMSAVLGVLAVNFAFTFPYFEFNVSVPGNTFSCLVMLFVAVMTSTLTTKVRRQEKLKMESEREKARADLLRAVSHDLRTPLTTIYGASSAVIENYDRLTQEQRIKMVKGIQEESKWLIRMVENLLSVTRLDGGKVSVIKTPVPIEELIDSVLLKFRKRYPDVSPQVSIPDDFICVPMDGLLIEQVLLNLMENAVLHAEGMTRLMLSVDIENGKAVFEVADDGSGTDEAKLAPLSGNHPKTERTGMVFRDNDRNSGIGLSVCAAIIKAHGGTIGAETSKRGTSVRFRLMTEEDGQNGKQ